MTRERSEAQRRAEAKYRDEHCDRIAIMIPTGQRDVWKQYAAERGLTLRQIIMKAVEEYAGNHKPLE